VFAYFWIIVHNFPTGSRVVVSTPIDTRTIQQSSSRVRLPVREVLKIFFSGMVRFRINQNFTW
jgi:hypothetical protein